MLLKWTRAAASAGLGIWLVATGCRPEPAAAPEVRPVLVAAARSASEVSAKRGAAYLATIKGRNQLTLSFRVPGIVELMGQAEGGGDWQEGSPIRRGQLLARLNQADFQTAVHSATAQAELDRSQFLRAERLLRDGAASQQDYDRARAAMLGAEAALKLRLQDLQDSRIVAPFDGTLLKREVSAGETVAAGQPLLTVADLSEVEVEVGVPDRLVGQVQVGSRVQIEVSAVGAGYYDGEVTEVGVAAREGSRLFRVVIRVPNAEGRIRPGMAASVFLDTVSRDEPGVVVPLSALVARGDRELAVFVVTNGVARERAVETRDLVQSSIVVTRGLEVGEQVVVSGASLLHEGAAVRVMPAESAGGLGAP